VRALQQAMEEEQNLTSTIIDQARSKAMAPERMDKILGSNSFGNWQTDSENSRARTSYSLFRGWVYAAIHAISSEGSLQDINVARKNVSPSEKDRQIPGIKSLDTIPLQYKYSASLGNLEIQPDHPLHSCMVKPNPLQDGLSFVYSFIANLCLTGWGYVIGGETGNPEQPYEFYSVPTTWITPDHTNGPFSKFWIKDPSNPTSKPEPLEREVVGFAHLPNPADMKSATAPAIAQIQAIRIDDHIQTSQENFFENGVFPSVIVEMGKDPHPDVPAGIRPRLSPGQRRQVMGAIRKVMGGVANYGSPAIVDGLIENIRPLSMTQREMGWDKSEDKARTRILSAFGVHPYIIGEPVNIGGYAQAAKIEERFCKRVNLFLRMLGGVMTGMIGSSEPLVIWWEACAPNDPALKWRNLLAMRANGDITRGEIRAEAGFSDIDPDDLEQRNKLLDSVGGLQAAIQILQSVGNGQIGPEAGGKLLSLFLEIEESDASDIVDSALDFTAHQLELQKPDPVASEGEEDAEEEDEEQEERE